MTTWIQEWEGFVLAADNETFWARLIDLTQPGPDEEAEIFLDKLPPEEREFVRPGAVFHWRIGKKGESEFKFSRERWTEEELQCNWEEAKLIAKPAIANADGTVSVKVISTVKLPCWKPKIN